MLAIDGCPIDCARKLLEKNGIRDFEVARVTDLGFEKGKTEIINMAAEMVINKAKNMLKGTDL